MSGRQMGIVLGFGPGFRVELARHRPEGHGAESSGATDLAQTLVNKKNPRCLRGDFSSVNCWDWTKATALPREPESANDPALHTTGEFGSLGRDALGLSHLT
jgi:hypothetical protein